MQLRLEAWRAARSRGTKVVVTSEGRSLTFGLGDSSVGAGSIGVSPVIQSGNEKLVFSTGFHYLQIKEVAVDP